MTIYSDQVYQNVSLSLNKFFKEQATLKGLDIRHLEEFDNSKFNKKPFLLISEKGAKPKSIGIDGGFFLDEIDDANKTVDTIYERLVKLEFRLDLGTNTATERQKWTAILDRIFDDNSDNGIAVYNLSVSSKNGDELGRLFYSLENDLAHNFLPENPGLRTFLNSIWFKPDYMHKFVLKANQPQLTGVELYGKNG